MFRNPKRLLSGRMELSRAPPSLSIPSTTRASYAAMEAFHVPFLEHFGEARHLVQPDDVAHLLFCARAGTQPYQPVKQVLFLKNSAELKAHAGFSNLPAGLGQQNNVRVEAEALGLDAVAKKKKLLPSAVLPWATAEVLSKGDLVRSKAAVLE